jgi:hypothetical protein
VLIPRLNSVMGFRPQDTDRKMGDLMRQLNNERQEKQVSRPCSPGRAMIAEPWVLIAFFWDRHSSTRWGGWTGRTPWRRGDCGRL